MRLKLLAVAIVAALLAFPALAQDTKQKASEETNQGTSYEVSLNFTGNFQKHADGLGVIDNSSYSAGFLGDFRYHFNESSALEVNYGATSFSQFYSTSSFTQSNVYEGTLAYVLTPNMLSHGRFHPFLELGTGGIFFSPVAGGTSGRALSQDRAAFVYGAGIDWRVSPRFALRAGYHGLVYRAPDFAIPIQVTNATTQMAEPYVGFSVRF
jgi:opacity protein-like surface antigen